ncbi:MAG: asparagine synthase-related protein [Rhodobacteraceae bacterium]|nr:asparagine synthase-related protein [Paracoccaceae bacterium]
MTGFAGFLAASGAPGTAEAALGRAFAGAGFDRLADGPGLALGQRRAAGPGGPWRDARTGCLLAGEIFLDDPAALAAALGLPPQTPDAGLVLAAHARWGEAAPDRLAGSFAYALWDPRRRRLLAVRDRFGIAPLAFHAAPQGLALAATPEAALRAAGIAAEPDEDWVADYLAGQETSFRRTAWRGVERLPPGHLLIAGGGRVELRRWWDLAPETLAAADRAPEALAEALDRAVRAALRGGATAAMLSGGLDSSALALLAARAAPGLPAVSVRYPSLPALDEGRFIAAVRAAGRLGAIEADGAATPALAVSAETAALLGAPSDCYGAGAARLAYRATAAAGCRAVIDGHGGDEVAGHGLWHLDALARAGRWGALWRLARAHRAFAGASEATDLGLHLARRGPRPLAALVRRLRPEAAADTTGWRALVRPDLAARSGLVARVRAAAAEARTGFPPDTAPHAALLRAPRTASAFEALAALAAAEGVAPRYPFHDPRVVRLCLNRPAAEKIAGGRPRAHLRAAMQGILPEAVRLRAGKTDFLPLLAAALRAEPEGRAARYRTGPPERLAPWVAPEPLAAAARALAAPGLPPPQALFHLWRALQLDRWLERLEAGGGAAAAPRAVPA